MSRCRIDGDRGGEPTFHLDKLSLSVRGVPDPFAPVVIRSSVLLRIWLAVFFGASAMLLMFAAFASTPGSAASVWTGHIFFGVAGLVCGFLAYRGAISGYLKVTADSVEIRRIRGNLVIPVSDIVGIDATADWRSYVVAPVLTLKSGEVVRLSDFGSPKSRLDSDPCGCACGRALEALRTGRTER